MINKPNVYDKIIIDLSQQIDRVKLSEEDKSEIAVCVIESYKKLFGNPALLKALAKEAIKETHNINEANIYMCGVWTALNLVLEQEYILYE